jgi:hypothetical protein
LLCAFDENKQPFRLFPFRQLPTSQRSVGMQMDIDRDVTGKLDREAKRKDRTLCDLFFLGS